MSFRLADYDFALPDAQIAQTPTDHRDAARLLLVDRAQGTWHDGVFADLPRHLRAGDVLVLNNTRVFPARLVGERLPTAHRPGGQAELLLIEDVAPMTWRALARPARRLTTGTRLAFGPALHAEVVAEEADGRRLVRFACDGPLDAAIDAVGRMPLPPYIKRPTAQPADRERYQTVYARDRGSIAAPTAGLHFTPDLLATLRAQGVQTVELTLHVGYGTFAPVRVDDLRAHRVAAERYLVTAEAAATLNAARAAGGRLVAVGTTSTRTLETVTDAHGVVHPGAGSTDLTITPGYRFRAVDALQTNFHLPQSSLLVLVASFAGRELVLAAYTHAVAAGYRFFSYGDAMLIV